MSHSAEFLRGAVEALRLLAIECRNRANDYRALLAQAQAREAGEPDAADVINELREALEEIDNYRGGADTVLDDKYVTERRREVLELADRYTPEVIPGTRESLVRLTIKPQPDAAAVIAQCKAFLDYFQTAPISYDDYGNMIVDEMTRAGYCRRANELEKAIAAWKKDKKEEI